MNNYLNLRKERGMNILTQKFVKSLLVILMVFGMIGATLVNSMIDIHAVDSEGNLEVGDTLSEIFPDEAFREYVYEVVLGKGDVYVDATHASHVLEQTDIDKIEEHEELFVDRKGINSLEGVQYFVALEILRAYSNNLNSIDVSKNVNLTLLHVSDNKLTNVDVSNNLQLLRLDVQYNEISSLDVSMLESLTELNIYNNPISQIVVHDNAKPNITSLSYMWTNIVDFDLSGFSSLDVLAVTHGAFLPSNNAITRFYVTGSRGYNDLSAVRFMGDAGFVTQDSITGYYVIAPNMNVSYGFNVSAVANGGTTVFQSFGDYQSLTEGGLVDRKGNLVIGATLTNVDSDGSIVLPSGGTIVTPEGTLTFDGKVSIKDGVIKTEDDYTFEKNTADWDSTTSTGTPNIGDIQTTINIPAGETTIINTNGSESSVPAGTVITNDDNHKFVVTGDATVDSEGNITSQSPWAELPAAQTHTVNPDGSITVPEGSLVLLPPDGSDFWYSVGETTIGADGTIILSDKALLQQIDSKIDALEDAGVVRATTTEAQFAEIQAIVDKIVDPTKKVEGQAKLDDARKEHIDSMLAALDVNPADGKIDLDVTLADFADIEDAIGYMTNNVDKLTAQGLVNGKKAELADSLIKDVISKMDVSVDASGNLTTTIGVADYEQIQDLITSLPNGAVKDGLQEELNDIRKDQIIDMIDALLDVSGDADPALATITNLDKIEDLIAAMPWSPQKEDVIDYFLDKFGDVYYLVMQGLPVYTGQSTLVSAQISTPFTKFTNVYIGAIGDDNVANWTPLIRSLDGGVTGQYIAYEGSTFITLTRSYLETFGNGTYEIKVVFGNNVYVPLQLVVAKPATTSPANPNVPNTPNTGVAGSVLPWMGLVAVSAGASTFFMKKKNEEEVE